MAGLDVTSENDMLRIAFDRPDAVNAITPAVEDAFIDALERAERDEDVRCVIVTGHEGAFSAGRDINTMRERFERDVDGSELRTTAERTTGVLVDRLYHLAVPTIASIPGPATGMGFGIAMACDLLVAGESASFGATFSGVGLGPDSGISYTLPRRIGTHRALELFYTGDLVEADRAAELGLVNRVVPDAELESTVTELAEDIAAGPTTALVAAKQLVQENANREFTAAVGAELREQAILYNTADHEEGVTAFLEDRDPNFTGE